MYRRYFCCPNCHKSFSIAGFWRWYINAPFHQFSFKEWQDYRYTKCPHCEKRSLMTWYSIVKL